MADVFVQLLPILLSTSCPALRSLTIAVKMAEMQRSHSLVNKLLNLLDERKDVFEDERKKFASIVQDNEPVHSPAVPLRFVAFLLAASLWLMTYARYNDSREDPDRASAQRPRHNQNGQKQKKQNQERTEKTVKETKMAPGEPKSKASAAASPRRSRTATATTTTATTKGGIATPPATLSFTSVRSESGAVSIRLDGRVACRGKENDSAASLQKKKKITTTIPTNDTRKAVGSNTGMGKRKREMVQPCLSFAAKQQ